MHSPIFCHRFAALLIAGAILSRLAAAEPLILPVWPGVPPGSEGKSSKEKERFTERGDHVISNVHRPSIIVYRPSAEAATGAAVLVIPGGGHRELWTTHEGHNVASWLSEHGVAAIILKYRLAREEGSTYTIEEHTMADVHRAMRLIRHHAAEWQIDPARVGVMGFSAGGELAARAGMFYDEGDPGAADVVARKGTKPAFQALIYPGGIQVIAPTGESPPAFLSWGMGDREAITEGMVDVYLRFMRAGVPVEMHVYSDANHGFGVRPSNQSPSRLWLSQFHEWLGGRGLLSPAG